MANMVLFGAAVVDIAVVAVAAVASLCPCCWPITIPVLAIALGLGFIGACVNNANGGKEPPPCPGRTDQCGVGPDAGQQCDIAVAGAYSSSAGMALVNASAGIIGSVVASASTSGIVSGGGNSFRGLVASPI